MSTGLWIALATFFAAIVSQTLIGIFGGRMKRLEEAVAKSTETCSRLTLRMALVTQRLGMHGDDDDDDPPRHRKDTRWPR